MTIDNPAKQISTKSVLVVEDDVLLAMDLAEQLQSSGFEVLGPCTSTQDALKILERENCDAAVLDINLGSETSEVVAHTLKSNGIPFVVASGYSLSQYPKVFSSVPALSKPIQTERLIALLNNSL